MDKIKRIIEKIKNFLNRKPNQKQEMLDSGEEKHTDIKTEEELRKEMISKVFELIEEEYNGYERHSLDEIYNLAKGKEKNGMRYISDYEKFQKIYKMIDERNKRYEREYSRPKE